MVPRDAAIFGEASTSALCPTGEAGLAKLSFPGDPAPGDSTSCMQELGCGKQIGSSSNHRAANVIMALSVCQTSWQAVLCMLLDACEERLQQWCYIVNNRGADPLPTCLRVNGHRPFLLQTGLREELSMKNSIRLS